MTGKQRQLIRALLTAGSIVDAARAAGVAESTAHRWLNLSGFKAELAKAERLALGQTVRRLISGSVGASGVLIQAMLDKEAPRATRITAASALLAHLPKLRAGVDFEERLAAIETALSGGDDDEP